MKKTLTIMMTAAAALLALSSCNDSDSSSPAAGAPISVADFTSGAKYFEVSGDGVNFTLSGEGSAESTDNNAGYATVNLTMTLTDKGKAYTSSATYTVEGSLVTLSGITSWATNDVDEDFCKVWGLTFKEGLKEDEKKYNLGSTPSFYIRISGGVARMIVTIPESDEKATVVPPENPVTYRVQVKTKQTSSGGDSAGTGSTGTPAGN